MSDKPEERFKEWNRARDRFELSWCSNESLLLAPIPANLEALKEFAWHVWQHASSAAALVAIPDGGELREAQYKLDDLVSRIWDVCVDTRFHYNDLSDDENCGVDAAVLAKEACAKIKELIQHSEASFDAEGVLLRKYIYKLRDVLRQHWLSKIVCHHAEFPGDETWDRPECACSEINFPKGKNVGEAVEMWINHVFVHAALLANKPAGTLGLEDTKRDWETDGPALEKRALEAGQAYVHGWTDGIEAAAKVVDDCNKSGPYQAIGAAQLIRELVPLARAKEAPAK